MITWYLETSPYCSKLDGHKDIFDVGEDDFGRVFRIKIMNMQFLPSFISTHISPFNETRAVMESSKPCSFKFGQHIIPESSVPSLVVPAGYIDKNNISLSIRLYLSGGNPAMTSVPGAVNPDHATLGVGVAGDDPGGDRGAVEGDAYQPTSRPPTSLASSEGGSLGGEHDYAGVRADLYINPDQMTLSNSSSSSR